MKQLMDDKVGIFRSGEPLKEAVEELKELLAKTKKINIKSKERAGNPELEEAYRVPMMLKVAMKRMNPRIRKIASFSDFMILYNSSCCS